MATELQPSDGAPRPAFYNDPAVRGIFYQVVVLGAGPSAGAFYLVDNTLENRARLGVASGFGFLGRLSGLRHLADA